MARPRPVDQVDPSEVTINSILAARCLTAVFQPVFDIRSGRIYGYEGLTRGPPRTRLESPLRLFEAAAAQGVREQAEQLATDVVMQRFGQLKRSGILSLNISPDVLEAIIIDGSKLREKLTLAGLEGARLVVELTETHAYRDLERLQKCLAILRALGARIAIDDLGAGYSSLRLWSELRPEFIKIDRHFIQNIHQDALKLHFVRSLTEIAHEMRCTVIAEGIELTEELEVVRDVGIKLAQGYLLGRPEAVPTGKLPSRIHEVIQTSMLSVFPIQSIHPLESVSASALAVPIAPVSSKTTLATVYQRFVDDQDLLVLPVVDEHKPIGLLNRHRVLEEFSRQYRRELLARRSCKSLMDSSPFVVEASMDIQSLSTLVAAGKRRHFVDGFLITRAGRYLGIGDGLHLMQEIARLQIRTAIYSNPLTLLPGSVPLDEHMQRLLDAGAPFAVAYCDLDNFKAYNDVYGYRRGDEVIRFCAEVLTKACIPGRDFLGHIGGDDFIIVFQNPEWEHVCRSAIGQFDERRRDFFEPEHLAAGGYFARGRGTSELFFPLVGLSIGALEIQRGHYQSISEVSVRTAALKAQAKRAAGSYLALDTLK